jgi:predicted chitinase
MLTITRAAWARFVPRCPAAYTDALFNNIALIEGAGLLENERRWCHFAATVGEETGGFTECRENLYYRSAEALKSAWPSRFGAKTDKELSPLLRNPNALGEAVYGVNSGRPKSDLGNVEEGDGYNYRGGGWIQTTGRGDVEHYMQLCGMSAPATPAVLDDPVATLKFALCEWKEAGCNTLADQNDLLEVAKAINTGSATSHVQPVGMASRKEWFAKAWAIWGESRPADLPAKATTVGDILKVAAPVAGGVAAVPHLAGNGGHPVTLPTPPADLTSSLQSWQAASQSVGDFLTFAAHNLPLLVGVVSVCAILWYLPHWTKK